MTAEHETPEACGMPELLTLYEEWRRLEQVAIFNGDEDAPWQAAFAAEDHFLQTPALTLAGLLFKLRYACLPDHADEIGHVRDCTPVSFPAVRAVLRDLEAMMGDTKVPHPVDHFGKTA